TADSNIAVVLLTVTAVNDAPVANNDTATTPEDTAKTIAVLANDTDADGDTLSVSAVTQGAYGSVTINGYGTVTYTPAPNFNGSSSSAEVNFTGNRVNDAPVAGPDSYATNEDATLTVAAPGVLANDTDVDSPSLTAVLVTSVASGSLSLNANGSFSYVPNHDFCGSDSFSYKASDGTASSDPVVVSLTVNCVNDTPVANPDIGTAN